MIKIDFLKKKKVFVKNKRQPNANMYWAVIFYSGFVLTVAVFIFGFVLFQKVNQEEAVSLEKDMRQLEKIHKARIDKRLEVFREREKISNQIFNSSNTIVDPSL